MSAGPCKTAVTIREYAKQLHLPNDRRAVCEVAEEAIQQKQGHLSYSGSSAGGGSGRTGAQRDRAADSGGELSRK